MGAVAFIAAAALPPRRLQAVLQGFTPLRRHTRLSTDYGLSFFVASKFAARNPRPIPLGAACALAVARVIATRATHV